MADEKISELPVATGVNASDVVPIVQSGTTKQAAASLLPGSIPITLNPGDVLAQGASSIVRSAADVNDQATFTADQTSIEILDVNDVSVLNLWTGGNYDIDGSLYLGDSVPPAFSTDPSSNQDNTVIGMGAMPSGDGATGNTSIGYASLRNFISGTDNVAIGATSAQTLEDGNNNVSIGKGTDILEPSGSQITLIGAQVDSAVGVTDNATAIGYLTTVAADNTVVIGNASVADVHLGFNDGTGVSNAKLHAASATFSTLVQLTPTADPPGSPAEGMIYADTDHHLYYYNGTTWKQLDN